MATKDKIVTMKDFEMKNDTTQELPEAASMIEFDVIEEDDGTKAKNEDKFKLKHMSSHRLEVMDDFALQ